jgi:hypothetical protein
MQALFGTPLGIECRLFLRGAGVRSDAKKSEFPKGARVIEILEDQALRATRWLRTARVGGSGSATLVGHSPCDDAWRTAPRRTPGGKARVTLNSPRNDAARKKTFDDAPGPGASPARTGKTSTPLSSASEAVFSPARRFGRGAYGG